MRAHANNYSPLTPQDHSVKPLCSFEAEGGMRCSSVTGVQTCALPIWLIFASNAEGEDQAATTSLLEAGANEGLRLNPMLSVLSEFSMQPIFEDTTRSE